MSKIGNKVLELDEKGLERTDENLGRLSARNELLNAVETEKADREWQLSKFSTVELEEELRRRHD